MSKYYKAEDVIERLAEQWHYEATIECPYAADDIEEWKQNARELYADLPTIEVSEDCISREDAVNALIAHFIPQTYTGEEVEQASKLARKIMANAPSVVPTTEQSSMVGEWIPCTKEGLPLTELGRKERQKWYGYKCSKCNFIYKGNALTESPFCQNCGADMRG